MTFENTVSVILEEGWEKHEDLPEYRRKRYAETVVFGAPFSLATPLELQRKLKHFCSNYIIHPYSNIEII